MKDWRRKLLCIVAAALFGIAGPASADEQQRAGFITAWQSAARGDLAALQSGMSNLQSYLLYPYLEYEDLRQTRQKIPPKRINAFLEQYSEWAFAGRLELVWLRTLGRQQRSAEFLDYYEPGSDIELQCHYVTARVRTKQTDDLRPAVESLWLTGKSQHEACDPAFQWLIANHGIAPGLAWQRAELALKAGQIQLSRYLERFMTAEERTWVDRWRRMRSRPLRTVAEAQKWPDSTYSRAIISASAQRLARSDAEAANRFWQQLQAQHNFAAATRGQVEYDIALYAAVSGSRDAVALIDRVPADAVDARLLQWRLRAGLAKGDWTVVRDSVDAMPPVVAADTRWRYWRTRAVEALGYAAESEAGFRALADESDYYGFLAADRLDLPYRICPVPMPNDPELVKQIKAKPGIQRALELRLVDLPDFARSEWLNVQRNLDRDGLRGAAAIAMEAGWADRSVFSMIASGDRQFYDQRFPVIYSNEINQQAQQQQIDSAWLFGIMRSESALDENVISTANAHGLMQITPATARQLTRRHNLAYRTPSQLLDGRYNIRMGTRYLRDLLDSYDDSQVVTLSAYNAGPNAAERWLQDRPAMPADIWIELIPYFETREYVPRVLAFTAIYDWRLGNPLRRVSSRMPDIGGKLAAVSSTAQVCAAGG